MAEDQSPIKAGGWALFAQPDGPNTEPVYLGCHDVDDMDQDLGDKTLTYCPDPAHPNRWTVTGSFRGEPGPVETTITTTIRKAKDTLQSIAAAGCPVPLYLLEIGCGRQDVFTNWDSQAITLYPADITSRGWQNLRKRVPGDQDESTRSFDISADDALEPYRPAVGRQTIGESSAILDISFCNDPKCADTCGQAADICESGYVVTESPAGSPGSDADVWYTNDKGQTWLQTMHDPFPAGDDIASVVCFPVGRSTTRVLVACGSVNAGGMTVAYSDDNGVTWTIVNVGAVVGQRALTPGALFALDSTHIWLAVTDGYIWFSDDGGITWTAQQSGALTANDLNYVHGSDANNLFVGGLTDVILKTTDGGLTWTIATATGSGDDILSVAVRSAFVAWLGTDGGDLWFTTDGGVTWTQRAFTGDGVGAVNDIGFANDLDGFMIHDTAAPAGTIFFTINGGYNWEALSNMPTNAGLNALWVCGPDVAYAVGEPSGGTGVILRAAGSGS